MKNEKKNIKLNVLSQECLNKKELSVINGGKRAPLQCVRNYLGGYSSQFNP